MSTNDVPGAVPANHDTLAMGNWAESAEDNGKSVLFIYSVENGTVVYSMFDRTKTPVLEYRDAMRLLEFEKVFTFKPDTKGKSANKGGKWVWHDKTPFPWDQLIKEGLNDGQKFASASDLLKEADRIRELHASHMGPDPEEPDDEEEDDDIIRDLDAPRGRKSRTHAERIAAALNLDGDQVMSDTIKRKQRRHNEETESLKDVQVEGVDVAGAIMKRLGNALKAFFR